MILCSEPCIHQQDGVCSLDGEGRITNALGGCCYFLPKDSRKSEDNDADTNGRPVQDI